MITIDTLKQIYGCTTVLANKFCDPLNVAMSFYDINTLQRQAMFLAQVGHESGRLVYVRELASGKEYEGRKDLGNTIAGDGVRFRGRGLIQITGRYNYGLLSKEFGIDLIANPMQLENPYYAAKSAGWFWKTHGCNELADKGAFSRITMKINGGLNGQLDREMLYDRAREVFGL